MQTDTASATDEQPPLRLLHYADLESVYDDPDRVGALAGLIDALRDERSLVVGAGDDTALGQLALLTDEGRAQAGPFFEAVAPDADTFGNHDFDLGCEWALEWAADVPVTYLCANLDCAGAERVPASTVVERGGTSVGLVGVAHPKTADLAPNFDGRRVTDPIPAARDALADLPTVDYRVVLSHCGARDADLASALDVDLVLGGHLHNRHAERVDGTLVVRTAGGGVELSEVSLGREPAVEFHEIPADGSGDRRSQADGADRRVDVGLVDTYRKRRAALGLDEVVARVDGELARTGRERFGGESRLGNFAADAFRETAGADVGLFPAGSLRTGSALSGDVTRGEVVSLCPFPGGVVELELDGRALRTVLTEAAAPHPGDRGWVQFHVSGAGVVWTDANDVGTVDVGGEPLDPDRTYRVATAEYAVVIDSFAPLDRENVIAEHDPQWQALVSHARGGGLDVELEGRIERVAAEPATD